MTRLFNHQKPWTETQCILLRDLFMANLNLESICAQMGRTGTSIVSKLSSLGLIVYDSANISYRVRKTGLTFVTQTQVVRVNEKMASYDSIDGQLKLEISAVQPTIKEKQEMKHVDTNAAVCVVITDSSRSESSSTTYIFGVEAKNVSDDQIFDHIARIETDIEKLSKIQAKPKKLVAKIDNLQSEVKKLIEFVDAR